MSRIVTDGTGEGGGKEKDQSNDRASAGGKTAEHFTSRVHSVPRDSSDSCGGPEDERSEGIRRLGSDAARVMSASAAVGRGEGHGNEGKVSPDINAEEIQSYMVLGTRFDVESRYSIINSVGQGAYGVVCAARDECSGNVVAIKKIERAFEHHTFTKRTLRELKLLRALHHENIIHLENILRPLNNENFDEIYCIFELMETDLSSIIKSPQALSEEHCQFFLYQILRGLKYIHSKNVIHRDLKPRNLLVNSNCDLKICDFGLARVDFPNLQGKTAAMTDYVATRWYRAPEVILTWEKYTKAIDMWSVGCIFAELLGRQPIFPGIDSQNQIQLIVDVIGYPDESVLSKIRSEKAKSYLERLPRKDGADLSILFPDCTKNARDLLNNLLAFDPEKRFDVNEAIEHPYLESLHCMEDEPIGDALPRLDFDFEHHFLTSSEYRELLLDEIKHYYDVNTDSYRSSIRK